jgi:nucleoside-diphosphate-sugar epimerase
VVKPVATVIQKCGEIFRRRSFRFADYLGYTVQDGVLNIGKAKRVLGYRPKVDLAEGMRKTVAWFLDYEAVSNNKKSLPVIELLTG